MLKNNIKIMLHKIKEFDLGVYISDDSSNSDTSEMIKNLIYETGYQNFFYIKNTPALGHDLNCFSSLKLPDSDYVWYLGDSVIIESHAIDKVMNIILGDESGLPDIISVNCDGKVNLTTGFVKNTLDFLVNTTWYITMTGASIYSRPVIEFSKKLEFKSSYKNFSQLAIILEYCKGNSKARYFWVNDNAIYVNKNKKTSYWSSNAINVFAVDWWNFVSHFSGLFDEKQMRCVALSHSKHTSILGFLNLLKVRSQNRLTRDILKQNQVEIEYTSKTPFFLIQLICYIPPVFLRFLLSIVNYLRG